MDSEIPPLEDVEHVMEKLKIIENAKESSKAKTNKVNASETKSSNSKPLSSSSSISKPSISLAKSSSPGFGGMKKGFLFGGSNKSTSQVKENSANSKEKTENKTKEGIPFLKSSKNKSNFVFNEVQEAMAADTKEYKHFQEDLEARISSSPKVTDVLSDPAWLPILEEFQTDPVKAMDKYKDDKEIRDTMQELCKAFGDSFLHMQSGNVSEEEKIVSDIMEDPKIKDALQDRLIMQIMVYMKQGSNDKVHRCLQSASGEQKRKIQLLVDHGLFAFSR